MQRLGSSTILSAITGAVLLIHVLGLVALMVQRSDPDVHPRPLRMAVQILDQTDQQGVAIALAEQITSEPAPVTAQEPPLAVIPPEPLTPPQDALALPAQAVAIVPPLSRDPIPSLPALQQSPTTPKKPAPAKVVKAETPARNMPQRERVAARPAQPKPTTPGKPVARPSDKLRSSSAAQAALKRLRQPAVADSKAVVSASHHQPQQSQPTVSSERSRISHERALDALMAALQNCVVVPEQGEVRMRIQINAEGRVTHMQCLKAASNRNREVIEKSLRLIRLPVEGLTHDGSLSVVVTFKHA